MFDLILYEKALQILDANPEVIIKTTGSKRMKDPRGYYHSHIDVSYDGDIRGLVIHLGQHEGNDVRQQAEHKCTLQRYSTNEYNHLLEEVVVQKHID